MQLLDRLPLKRSPETGGFEPLLSPVAWAAALTAAWGKSTSVSGILQRLSDAAKLAAGKAGIPEDDLEDPRFALMKFEVERDAPPFVKDADLPLRDKHFLTHVGSGDITDREMLALKREVVDGLLGAHKRYREQRAAYEGWLEQASPEDFAAAYRGTGQGIPPYPQVPATAERAWERALKRRSAARREAEERERQDARDAVLQDPEKTIQAVVGRLKEAAPKVFGEGEVGGEPAWQVLERRLRAMPHPELVLLAAVLLKTSVNHWLRAAQDEMAGEEE